MDETRLRGLVADYLDRRVRLADVDRSAVELIWNENAPAAARALANEIVLRIDELAAHVLDESALRHALEPLVTSYSTCLNIGSEPSANPIRTAAQSTTSESPITTPTLVGTKLVVVHA